VVPSRRPRPFYGPGTADALGVIEIGKQALRQLNKSTYRVFEVYEGATVIKTKAESIPGHNKPVGLKRITARSRSAPHAG
jgi:hypothetical protein